MINKEKDEEFNFHLICDYCGKSIGFMEFQNAVNYKKMNKWKSYKINNEWYDKCSECLEKGE